MRSIRSVPSRSAMQPSTPTTIPGRSRLAFFISPRRTRPSARRARGRSRCCRARRRRRGVGGEPVAEARELAHDQLGVQLVHLAAEGLEIDGVGLAWQSRDPEVDLQTSRVGGGPGRRDGDSRSGSKRAGANSRTTDAVPVRAALKRVHRGRDPVRAFRAGLVRVVAGLSRYGVGAPRRTCGEISWGCSCWNAVTSDRAACTARGELAVLVLAAGSVVLAIALIVFGIIDLASDPAPVRALRD
jgi:hypothetical protein